MTFSSIVDRLNQLRPDVDSINEDFNQISRRTFCEIWIGRIFHFLTCGLIAKNSALDRTCRKVMICAEGWLVSIQNVQITEDRKKSIVQAFTHLKQINDNNDGSAGEDIQSIINKLSGLKPLTIIAPTPLIPPQPPTLATSPTPPISPEPPKPQDPTTTPTPPEAPTPTMPTIINRLNDQLDNYLSQTQEPSVFFELIAFGMRPELQARRLEIDQACMSCLLRYNSNMTAYVDWYSAFIEFLVRNKDQWKADQLTSSGVALILQACAVCPLQASSANAEVLSKLLDELVQLPDGHALIQPLAYCFTHIDDFAAKEPNTIAQNAYRFLTSEGLKKLFGRLTDQQPWRLMHDVSRHCLHYTIDSKDANEEMRQSVLAFVSSQPVHLRKQIFEGLRQASEPTFLAQLALQDGFEAEQLRSIVRNCFERGDQKQFAIFADTLLASSSPNRAQVLVWMFGLYFSFPEPRAYLIDKLAEKDLPFLVRHIGQLPWNAYNHLDKGTLWPVAAELFKGPWPESEKSLPALSGFLVRGRWDHFKFYVQYPEVFWAFYTKAEEVDIQAEIIVQFLLSWKEHPDSPLFVSAPEKFNASSSATWAAAGAKFIGYCKSWPMPDETIKALFSSIVEPMNIVAFCNACATNLPKLRDQRFGEDRLSEVMRYLIKPSLGSQQDLAPFYALSDEALACFRSIVKVQVFGTTLPAGALLIRSLTNLADPRQKRLLLAMTSSVFNDENCLTQSEKKSIFEELANDQIEQLPWRGYPGSLPLAFALRLGKFEPETLRGCVARAQLDKYNNNFSFSELFKKWYWSRYSDYIAFMQAIVDVKLPQQPPLVERLILDAFENEKMNAQQLPIPQTVLDSLDFSKLKKDEKNHHARTTLLRRLSPVGMQRALDAWELERSSQFNYLNRELLDKGYPLANMIAASESPNQFTYFILLALGNIQLGNTSWPIELVKGKHHVGLLDEIFQVLEQMPWKLWPTLHNRGGSYLDLKVLKQWLTGNRKYPECLKVIQAGIKLCDENEAYRPNMGFICEKGDAFRKKLDALVKYSSSWIEAYEYFTRADNDLKSYLCAGIKSISPHSLVHYFKEYCPDSAAPFAILCDEEALLNLQKAICTGVAPQDAFGNLAPLVETILQSETCPAPLKRNLQNLVKGLSLGGLACPVSKLNRDHLFSDLDLQFDKEVIPAHQLIIGLDPFFKPFNQSLENGRMRMVIPAEKIDVVKYHLACLYGTLSLSEAIAPEAQQVLRDIPRDALATLWESREMTRNITLIAKDGKIKVHKEILASAFDHFDSLFRSGMKESQQTELEYPLYSVEQLTAVLECAYKNEWPEFEDEQSSALFHECQNYFRGV